MLAALVNGPRKSPEYQTFRVLGRFLIRATPDPMAQLQALEPIRLLHALHVHVPIFTVQQHVHAPLTTARTGLPYFAQPTP